MGPAIVPSLVMCPTSRTASAFCFAYCVSFWATSLIWPMLPGAEPTSGSAVVWIESITTTRGRRSFIAASIYAQRGREERLKGREIEIHPPGPEGELRPGLLPRDVEGLDPGPGEP